MFEFKDCNVEALNHVIRVLEKVEDINFNISHWVEDTCGYSACAIGWACQNKWFSDQNFILNKANSPMFMGETRWDAIKIFFNLTFQEACYLFNGDYYLDRKEIDNLSSEEFEIRHQYITPDHVIDRIKEVLGDRYEKV